MPTSACAITSIPPKSSRNHGRKAFATKRIRFGAILLPQSISTVRGIWICGGLPMILRSTTSFPAPPGMGTRWQWKRSILKLPMRYSSTIAGRSNPRRLCFFHPWRVGIARNPPPWVSRLPVARTPAVSGGIARRRNTATCPGNRCWRNLSMSFIGREQRKDEP